MHTTESFVYAVVLTGGIATGKSSAAAYFAAWGCDIIDADKIAHEILDAQRESIARLFGDAYVREGRVDRKALGRLVFADVQQRKRLESLLHPLIEQEISARAEALDQDRKPYLIDIPLFFESRRYPVKHSIVVYAPREIQLQRLMQREGYSEAEARSRIEAQLDIEIKKAQASYVIDNSGTLARLERECRRVRALILNDNWL